MGKEDAIIKRHTICDTRHSRKIVPVTFFLLLVFGISPAVHAQEMKQELFTAGQKAFEERRYQDAINNFEAIIERDNGFAPAYHALGLVYQEVSPDPYYPLWYFETAVEINPDFAPSYDILCRSYYQIQQYTDAEKVCLRALELNPDLLSSQLSLAWVYLIGYSDSGKAIYFFEKVVEQIKVPAVYFGLGMAYAMEGNHGNVLDVVTYLRSEGAEDFARHLESIVRSKAQVEQFRPKGFQMSSSEEARPPEQPPVPSGIPSRKIIPIPVPIVVRPKITSGPRVRIRGKIKQPQVETISAYSEPETRGGQKGRHPGSLGEW